MYDGVGAILGGGGNARYLMEYPRAQRRRILNYLFRPGYGASLQLLKLEIGGDGNSTVGAEASVEHRRGRVDCRAGYEFDIARRAVAINPKLKLYGLQWGAPGWVGGSSLFTRADISYLVHWLDCAERRGLTIDYLGGWNEKDDGSHARWFRRLRRALNANGYRNVKIVAGDARKRGDKWSYARHPGVAILGAHNNCGYPTGVRGPRTRCTRTRAARRSGKPLWGSEMGAIDADARNGCNLPCAPAMVRAFTREYIDARVTGALHWPAIISMPAAVLPYQNRGLVTANQPWSGHYRVNAMTWVIAHITQFVWPPNPSNPRGWRYLNSASGYLQGRRTAGSYVTLLRSSRTHWSSIVEATAAGPRTQRVRFVIKGGRRLARKTVHVWSSNFNFNTGGPRQWFRHRAALKPVDGRFTLRVKRGHVYSLTTTTGQRKHIAAIPPASPLRLPYANDLAGGSGEPRLLAAQDGAFELRRCRAPDGHTTCTRQTAVGRPVLWIPGKVRRRPYAIIGGNWRNYRVSVDVRLRQRGSAGLIARYDAAAKAPSHGTFDGYVFDVHTNGRFTLSRRGGGTAVNSASGQQQVTPATSTTLASGAVRFDVGSWHRLVLTVSRARVSASVDGRRVATIRDRRLEQGMPGVHVGGWYPAEFSNLRVRRP
jgi:hypothetical protein